MERLLRADFSQVRVHTDSRAQRSAEAIGALAYTHGRDIYFGPNEYRPRSRTGDALLAHELTHVLQQRNHLRGPAVQAKRGKAEPKAKPVEVDRRLISWDSIKRFFNFKDDPPKESFGELDKKIKKTYTLGPGLKNHKAGKVKIEQALYSVFVTMVTQKLIRVNLPSSADVVLELGSGGGGSVVYNVTYVDMNLVVTYVGPARRVKKLSSTQEKTLEKRLEKVGIKYSKIYSKDQQAVYRVLSKLSDVELEQIRKLTVRGVADPADMAHGDAAGDYDPNEHVISLLTGPEADDSSRVYEEGGSLELASVREEIMLHELGHAMDDRGEKKSNLSSRKAFKEAARADKIKLGNKIKGGITEYSNTTAKELFAETFMMFKARPTVLQKLRPNLYKYMRALP